MQKTVVWCVGNTLLQDDGAGPYLFELLQGRASEDFHVVDCATTPENYILPLTRMIGVSERRTTLFIVDAAEMGLPGGAVRRMCLDDLKNIVFSSHGIPFQLLLAPYEEHLEVLIFGVQPARRGVGTSLSPEVARAVEELADLLCERRWKEMPFYHENCSPR